MRTNSSIRHRPLRVEVLAVVIALTLGGASGADYFWDDGNVTVDGASGGGSGTWNVGVAGWEDGTAAVNWANNHTAILGGTAGTLTLGGDITAAGITVQSSSYQITGSQGLTAGAITVASDASLEIANGNSALTWSALTGAGTPTINKPNSINVTTTFNTANALNFTGTLRLRGGSATTSRGSVAGSWTAFGGPELTQAAGTSFKLDTGLSASNARDFILTDAFNGATLTVSELKGYGAIRADWGSTGTRTLLVNQSSSTAFDGLILAHIGAGGQNRQLILKKDGPGTLTLAGYLGYQTASSGGNGILSLVLDGGSLVLTNDANDYLGPTTINAGTLRIGNGGSTGTIGSSGTGAAGNAVTVAAGAALVFDRTGLLDYKNNPRMRHVTGGGDIILTRGVKLFNYPGTGTGFNEANSWNNFSGRLIIKDGAEFQTIRNGRTAMGTATIILGDGTTAGKLSQIEGNWTWTNPIEVNGAGNEILNNSTGSDRWLKLQGPISGVGTLRLADTTGAMNNGNLGFILTGANTFTGTLIVDTFVRVGGVGGEDNATPAGPNGALAADCTVQINSGRRLTFSRSDAHTVAALLTGPGSVWVGSTGITGTGSQVVTLTADNTYTGATVVNNGVLYVNGSLAADSAVTVHGGTLGGLGTVQGPVTINAAGTLAPGAGGLGTLSANNTLILAGTTALDVHKSGQARTSDLVTGITTLTCGGAVTVNATGDALAAGDEFTVFSANTFQGSFSSITPAPSATLAWDTNRLATQGKLLVHHRPVAGSDAASIPRGQSVVLAGAKLLANDGDADGDPLSIVAVAAAGGTATLSGPNIHYTAPGSGSSDTITYTISDGRGGLATGTITVTLTSPDAPSLNVVAGPVLENNQFKVTFAGIPGRTYTVEDSTVSATGPWSFLTNLTAGPNGLFELVVPNDPPAEQRYFRTTAP